MLSKKSTLFTLIAVLALIAVIALVPTVLAQGPNGDFPGPGFNQGDGTAPYFGRGPMMRGNFGPGMGQFHGPMMGNYANPSQGYQGYGYGGPMMNNYANPPQGYQGYGYGGPMMNNYANPPQGYQGYQGYGYGGPMMYGGPGRGWNNSMLAFVADFLGLTPEALLAELETGQSIADVVVAHEGDLGALVDAFIADRAERMAYAVETGRLSQENLDAHLAEMETQIMDHLNTPWTEYAPAPGAFGPCPYYNGYNNESGEAAPGQWGRGPGMMGRSGRW